jgi:hypothetical protein
MLAATDAAEAAVPNTQHLVLQTDQLASWFSGYLATTAAAAAAAAAARRLDKRDY